MDKRRSTRARRARLAIIGATALGGATLPAVGLAATPALAGPPPPSPCSLSANIVTCTYNAPGAATFTVPAGVGALTVTADGANGAGISAAPGPDTFTVPAGPGPRTVTADSTNLYTGGLGGEAQATLTGATGALTVFVGMAGSPGTGGSNSGGNGGAGFTAGGGGGAASTVAAGSTVLIAAGGGGGAAMENNGGNGGSSSNPTGASGGPGFGSGLPGGQGGTPAVGGAAGANSLPACSTNATAGTSLQGGNGATGGGTCWGGGGGGGGYFGGGGGGSLPLSLSFGGGGGGGSAFPASTTTLGGVTVTPDTEDGNTNPVPGGSGLVTISYHQIVATATTLSSSRNPSFHGQSVTFTATVSPTDGGGTVTFTNTTTATTLCSAVALTLVGSNYQATCTTSTLPAGSNSIEAAYSGDVGYSPSSDTLTQQVFKDPTNLSASIYFNSGQTFTVTATLTSFGGPVSGEPVSFSTGFHHLCTVNTNTFGVARCVLTGSQTYLVEENNFTITAVYPGSATLGASFATAHISMFP